MNREKLTQLIQLKIMEKYGAKVAESPEMKALTEEIAGLFTIQNTAVADEIKQLQQAVNELTRKQQISTKIMKELHNRLNNHRDKINLMDELLMDMADELGFEFESCDCPLCQEQEREQAKAQQSEGLKAEDLKEILSKLPFKVIRVTD